MQETNYLEVEIKKATGTAWYKVGEKHRVLNRITFGFSDNDAYFSKGNGVYGIKVTDCKILNPNIKKLTIAEKEEELGSKIEDFIDGIVSNFEQYQYGNISMEEVETSIREAVQSLINSAKENKWISIEDKPPKGKYTLQLQKEIETASQTYQSYGDRCKVVRKGVIVLDTTHWFPLPKPLKQ